MSISSTSLQHKNRICLVAGGAFLLLAVLAACQPKTAETSIVITEHGTDKPDPICNGFQLTAGQAKVFFDKAKLISGEEFHNFTYLPCWVKGTIKDKDGGVSKWTIHPIGVARVTHADGKQELLGCKDCDDLFK